MVWDCKKCKWLCLIYKAIGGGGVSWAQRSGPWGSSTNFPILWEEKKKKKAMWCGPFWFFAWKTGTCSPKAPRVRLESSVLNRVPLKLGNDSYEEIQFLEPKRWKKNFFTLIGSYVSYKRYFGKNFIRNDGDIMKVNEVNCLSYRSWPGFYGVTLKISVVGEYPGSDWTKPVIIGGTQRKRQDWLWMSSSGKPLKRGVGCWDQASPTRPQFTGIGRNKGWR